ncbi:hypothetical protein JY440_13975 [Stenotrophomonas maltophilia]|uniref:hypothetical protein n=1 Tax=Stenotrophomonas maltophilia TaxID=40324 RepID=UPI0012B2D7EF|nr:MULTISPECIES: hypothetical protein [Stenotrophomonas]MBN4984278.1 hypothetical protein [Stenotrophomonas maltophilia]MDQ7300557.1 hypothetical protein [Stenotrophomonas sp. Sm2017]
MAILAGLLAMSLWLNVRQYGDRREAAAAARAAALEDTLKVTAGIARQAQTDSAELLQRLEAIAARGERTRTIYRAAAAAQPLPANCAPGQARVNAINQALGPTSRTAK